MYFHRAMNLEMSTLKKGVEDVIYSLESNIFLAILIAFIVHVFSILESSLKISIQVEAGGGINKSFFVIHPYSLSIVALKSYIILRSHCLACAFLSIVLEKPNKIT